MSGRKRTTRAPGRMRGGTSGRRSSTNGSGDHTIRVGASMPLRSFDRNWGEIARTHSDDRGTAARPGTELQVVRDVNSDVGTYRTQRAVVISPRDLVNYAKRPTCGTASDTPQASTGLALPVHKHLPVFGIPRSEWYADRQVPRHRGRAVHGQHARPHRRHLAAAGEGVA